MFTLFAEFQEILQTNGVASLPPLPHSFISAHFLWLFSSLVQKSHRLTIGIINGFQVIVL